MIDEEKQDRLIEHLLGSLDSASAAEVAAELEKDPELAQFAAELGAAAASLAHAAPLHRPPPALRSAVLAAARGEIPASHLVAPRCAPARLPDWVPWAIAAGVALAAVIQFALQSSSSNDLARLRTELEASREEANQLRQQAAALSAQTQQLAQQSAQLEQELATWKKRDGLSEVRIASLTSALTKAGAVVVWDAEQQRGIVKLSNLPKAAAGKDYQLWVIDPKYPSPVSAGIVNVSANGSGYVSFSPAQPITTPDKFAISMEKAGGAPAPAGPILLIGE